MKVTRTSTRLNTDDLDQGHIRLSILPNLMAHVRGDISPFQTRKRVTTHHILTDLGAEVRKGGRRGPGNVPNISGPRTKSKQVI